MGKKYLFITLIVALALSIIPTIAEEYPLEIQHQIIQDITSSEGTAEYNILITNNEPREYKITLQSEPGTWNFDFEKNGFTIRAYEEKAISLKVTPPKNVMIGSHTLAVTAKHKDGEIIGKHDFKVNIDTDLTPLDANINLPYEAGPAEELALTVVAENHDIAIMKDITLKITSDALEKDYEFNLGTLNPLQSGTISDTLRTKSQLPKGTYQIYIKAYSNTKIVASKSLALTVKSQPTLIVNQAKGGLFSQRNDFTITNQGNAKYDDEYQIKITGTQRYITSGNPLPATSSDNGKEKTMGWKLTLNPGESATVSYSTNYWLAILLTAVTIFFIVFATKHAKHNVTIKKELAHTKVDGVKVIKVSLAIKNRKRKTLKNCILYDYIPAPLKLAKNFDTAAPSIIKQEDTKTKLVWKLDTLDPLEERHISYHVKATLKVIGKIILTPAKLAYKKGEETVHAESNSIDIVGKD